MAEFDLHVTFAGLCMLVDDTQGSDKRIHALLPWTGGGLHPHEARLMFNKGHETGGIRLDPPPVSIPLENRKLTLDPKKGPPVPNLKPSNVFDLGAHTQLVVPRSLVDTGDATSQPNQSIARMTITGGKIARRKKGARWTIGAKPADHMAISVTFVTEKVSGSSLTLELEPLNKNGTRKTIELFPVKDPKTGKDVIELWIYHSPKGEFPAQIPPEYQAPRDPKPPTHFLAYYQLLSSSTLFEIPVHVDHDAEATMDLEPPPETFRSTSTRAQGQGSVRGRAAQAGAEPAAYDERSDTGADGAAALASGELVSCILVTAKPG